MPSIKKQAIKIGNIPAIIWGDPSGRAYIFVHGKMGSKDDAEGFAQIANDQGCQVISFDLPGHGDRSKDNFCCMAPDAVGDLLQISAFVTSGWKEASLYANSLGAYFSLLAYQNLPLKKCLFVSPILDMLRLTQNIMAHCGIDEKQLEEQREIPTVFGETLYWDLYCYIKEHPIEKWNIPTEIIYASTDIYTERSVLDSFVKKFHCGVFIYEGGEHWFHTDEQLEVLYSWVKERI